ncbi:dihydroxy-acid dehydratase [Oleispirillum naphthae]|uniref:dihydroxy-acid dehydratase n=1 Tax=Oleispirillum naphthae TaxID=2838853 RepID=UPI003082352E
MRKYDSEAILQGEGSGFYRSLYKAMGYSNDELDRRPMIGIANSWTTLVPGHANLRQVGEFVKNGIYRGGGTAVEFGVIAACDGIAQGHDGMHFILPSRELICDSIEVQVRAHRLDALVMLASCDKIVPGMLMAAARLDIPAIMVHGGPMAGGVCFDGRKSDLTSISEARGMYSSKKISLEEYTALEDLACPGCGSCSFLGTANTMCCLTEVLGMCLPGGALIPAVHSDRLRSAYASGMAVCELARKGITARRVMSAAAMENAVKVTMAISGSTNAVLHLSAVANEAQMGVSVLQLFEKHNKSIPQIAKVNPAAKWDMEAFWQAGGIPRVMRNMRVLLDEDVATCTGLSLKENLDAYRFQFPENREIIRKLDDPFGLTGGIAVLRGNLAPNSGISKPGAIDPALHRFKGKAKVFNSEEAAEEAILNGGVVDGDVVVIRYEGPKGGPGMREMFMAMKYLYGRGLNKSTALITDGRFSGTNNGCFVGHISPEAAEGGPLAIVEDGDLVSIDVIDGILNLEVSDAEIARRLAGWKKPPRKFTTGYLELYSRVASSAAEGAIIRREME